jgi:hypothetical protein
MERPGHRLPKLIRISWDDPFLHARRTRVTRGCDKASVESAWRSIRWRRACWQK